jgi:hypothetical protein
MQRGMRIAIAAGIAAAAVAAGAGTALASDNSHDGNGGPFNFHMDHSGKDAKNGPTKGMNFDLPTFNGHSLG